MATRLQELLNSISRIIVVSHDPRFDIGDGEHHLTFCSDVILTNLTGYHASQKAAEQKK